MKHRPPICRPHEVHPRVSPQDPFDPLIRERDEGMDGVEFH